MTNKTERYFVCSESELIGLIHLAFQDGQDWLTDKTSTANAAGKFLDAACRAREVFWFDVGKAWVEVDK